jgi:hypothetical protein
MPNWAAAVPLIVRRRMDATPQINGTRMMNLVPFLSAGVAREDRLRRVEKLGGKDVRDAADWERNAKHPAKVLTLVVAHRHRTSPTRRDTFRSQSAASRGEPVKLAARRAAFHRSRLLGDAIHAGGAPDGRMRLRGVDRYSPFR